MVPCITQEETVVDFVFKYAAKLILLMWATFSAPIGAAVGPKLSVEHVLAWVRGSDIGPG